MEKRNKKDIIYPAIVFGLLFLTWMVFSGLYDLFHLSLGVISCALITWLSSDLLFEHRDRSVPLRIRQAFRLIFYLLWLLWEVVIANLHLLRLAFSSSESLQPHIFRYESSLKTDFEKYLLANSITLTPGTVTAKIIGNTFYIHAISDIAAEGLDGEMERRIAHIFEESRGSGSQTES